MVRLCLISLCIYLLLLPGCGKTAENGTDDPKAKPSKEASEKEGASNKSLTALIAPKAVNLYAVCKGGKCGLVDRDGKEVVADNFEYIAGFRGERAAINVGGKRGKYSFMEGGKFGFIDTQGKIVINPLYESVHGFNQGVVRVLSDGKFGFIDTNGLMVIAPQFTHAGYFSEGKVNVTFTGRARHIAGSVYFAPKDAKVGYIDTTGKIVIEPKFESGYAFSEGLATVKQGGKWGYIDSQGAFAIKPQFDMADDFKEGLACVKIGDNFGYIHTNGKYVINPSRRGKCASMYEGVATPSVSVKGTEDKGLTDIILDKSGKVVLDKGHYDIGDFAEGLAMFRMKKGEKCGYLDKAGVEQIKAEYDSCGKFKNGRASVKIAKRWGLINSKGRFTVNPMYDDIATPSADKPPGPLVDPEQAKKIAQDNAKTLKRVGITAGGLGKNGAVGDIGVLSRYAFVFCYLQHYAGTPEKARGKLIREINRQIAEKDPVYKSLMQESNLRQVVKDLINRKDFVSNVCGAIKSDKGKQVLNRTQEHIYTNAEDAKANFDSLRINKRNFGVIGKATSSSYYNCDYKNREKLNTARVRGKDGGYIHIYCLKSNALCAKLADAVTKFKAFEGVYILGYLGKNSVCKGTQAAFLGYETIAYQYKKYLPQLEKAIRALPKL